MSSFSAYTEVLPVLPSHRESLWYSAWYQCNTTRIASFSTDFKSVS